MEGKTEDLLSLPRVQANIAAEIQAAFQAQAFDVNKCAEVIAEIALDKSKSGAERLRAVDMYVRMSFGYVPSSSVSLHKHESEKRDKWFDRDVFQTRTEIEMDEPKNVTPK